MIGNMRFTVWVHRGGERSILGTTSSPVSRDGLILTFHDEGLAHAECDRLNGGSGDPYARYSVEKELTVRAELLGPMHEAL
jgi:hypothetical protein